MRGDTCSRSPVETSELPEETQNLFSTQRRSSEGSRNRNKTQGRLSDTLQHLQTMIKALLKRIDDLIPVRYLVLDGYFGHNNALQMTQECGLALISKLRHKKFPDPLNVVCILKTHLLTEKKSDVLLFSSDLALDAEKIIDYYRLRFQIEFNFRDAKQYWGFRGFYEYQRDSREQRRESLNVHGKCVCETAHTLAFRTQRV